MAENTKIEWTDATWNPIRARDRATGKIGWFCIHESEGCRFCYAETFNRRLGTGIDYRAQDRDKIEIFLDEKTLLQPLHWRRPRKIFTLSMSDLFGEFVPDEMIDRVFAVMALCPQHTFQVLTKRAARMRDYLTADPEVCSSDASTFSERVMAAAEKIVDTMRSYEALQELADSDPCVFYPLNNVWLGVSVEDQARADERIPLLLDTAAAVRFISAEPLLGAIDLKWLGHDGGGVIDALTGEHWIEEWHDSEGKQRARVAISQGPHLDWVIAGGESGPNARPMNIESVRSIIRQCRAAGVACFVKQLGRWPEITDGLVEGTRSLQMRDRKGGDWSDWPEDLRVREFPDAA